MAALLLVEITPTRAQALTRYIAPGGNCGGFSPCCTTVQAAVDASQTGDEICVAASTYTGVHSRPSPPGYAGPAAVTQIVYINKTVTIEGGYDSAFTGPPEPEANPTTLDAQGQRRVLFITGNISPTIEGLRITGGDVAGLGGLGPSSDAGGGVYAIACTITFSNNEVVGNIAWDGGGGSGLYLNHTSGVLANNTISDNTAGWSCGGLAAVHSVEVPVIYDGHVVTNSASIASNSKRCASVTTGSIPAGYRHIARFSHLTWIVFDGIM
ncbi:MAG: hypothetical protein JXA14_19055 [Anaerolineae bacterium]|nr:hypothetical protein [Anaerolineae bacterium]